MARGSLFSVLGGGFHSFCVLKKNAAVSFLLNSTRPPFELIISMPIPIRSNYGWVNGEDVSCSMHAAPPGLGMHALIQKARQSN